MSNMVMGLRRSVRIQNRLAAPQQNQADKTRGNRNQGPPDTDTVKAPVHASKPPVPGLLPAKPAPKNAEGGEADPEKTEGNCVLRDTSNLKPLKLENYFRGKTEAPKEPQIVEKVSEKPPRGKTGSNNRPRHQTGKENVSLNPIEENVEDTTNNVKVQLKASRLKKQGKGTLEKNDAFNTQPKPSRKLRVKKATCNA